MVSGTLDEAAAPSEKSVAKVALTALGSASIEWYDFFLYGTAAALVFPTLFFPADLPPLVAQLAAFSTFAVGFIARPIGGVLFGHFGDLYGRKRALVVALLMMGVATTLVGILPTYEMAGVAAPLMLVVLRFTQGLAIGGQWGGAALLAIESAPQNKRGFYGSFVQVGVPVGVLLANLVFLAVNAVVPSDDFQQWGWRIPFLLSIVLVFLGLYVQLKLEDSPEFRALEAARKDGPKERPKASPILRAIKGHWPDIALAGGAFIANNCCFYLIINYAVAYGTTTLHLPRADLLAGVMIGSVAMIPALLGFAALSDRYGRYPVYVAGTILSGIVLLFFFPLIETGVFVNIALAMVTSLGIMSIMYGPQAALFAELFSTELRYSGASLGYQIGAVFGGGFAPIIATALYAEFKTSAAVTAYMVGSCVVSLVSVVILGYRQRGKGVGRG